MSFFEKCGYSVLVGQAAPNKLIELEKISKFRKQNENTPVNVHGYERASSNPSRRLDSYPLMINKQGNK